MADKAVFCIATSEEQAVQIVEEARDLGFSNDDISTRLFIARRTVETHRQRIMNKLSAHSIVQMQRLAARYGGLGL